MRYPIPSIFAQRLANSQDTKGIGKYQTRTGTTTVIRVRLALGARTPTVFLAIKPPRLQPQVTHKAMLKVVQTLSSSNFNLQTLQQSRLPTTSIIKIRSSIHRPLRTSKIVLQYQPAMKGTWLRTPLYSLQITG